MSFLQLLRDHRTELVRDVDVCQRADRQHARSAAAVGAMRELAACELAIDVFFERKRFFLCEKVFKSRCACEPLLHWFAALS